jgi:hypothetical protein
MQDVQVTGYDPDQGEPYLFHVVRVVWVSSFGERNPGWVQSPGREAQSYKSCDLSVVLRHVFYLEMNNI